MIATLGLGCIVDEPEHGLAGYAETPVATPQFYLMRPIDGRPASVGNGQTFAFEARDRATVHRFHETALANGATDEGAPGLRPAQPSNYYGAYMRDLDGHKICCVCHRSEGLAEGGRSALPRLPGTAIVRPQGSGEDAMRIEIAVDAREGGVGEGPFWDDIEQDLWWVDISGKGLHRWHPATGEQLDWRLDDFPSAVVLRERGGLLLAMRDGLYFMDPLTAERTLFLAHEPDRPGNRTNEASVLPTAASGSATMQNNLNPDGSGKAMTEASGALYRVRHDGGITREVDGVNLSNTLAWKDGGKTLLFADTGTGIIKAYDVEANGRLGASRVFSDEELPGLCDGSAIDSARAISGTPASPAPASSASPPTARSTGRFDLPVTQPTSCCFGGPTSPPSTSPPPATGYLSEALARNRRKEQVLAIETGIRGTPSVRFAG